MSRIGAKNTKPEITLRKALWGAGLRGYRLHWQQAPGRPDIAFPGRSLAVFVHGCFWHRCPHCQPAEPRTHSKFWREKFARNRARDERKIKELRKAGWRSITIWECRLNKSLSTQVARVERAWRKG